jgi:FAD/FMN-containing dehydrogenase
MSFYKDRHLPEPADEHFPQDVAELETLVVGASKGVPRLPVGAGEHLRESAIGEQRFEAVRTERCDHILELDRQSNLVRVEAGIRWGDLRDKLAEEGYDLQRYRPYPEASTVGGLLARRHPCPVQWRAGDLREGCVALSSVSPTLGDYRYLQAPRKASGPDLRHLFMGGEGLLGVILNVTLSVFKPFPGRVFEWQADSAQAAVAKMGELTDRGIRPTWCDWKLSRGRFRAVVYAPTRLLDAMVKRLRAHYGEQVSFGLRDRAISIRRQLEGDMPGRRSRDSAKRSLALTYSLADLGQAVDALTGVDDIEIVDWSAHTAVAYVTFDDVPDDGWQADEFGRALDVQPIVGGPAQTWPEWAQKLKGSFDKNRRLAVGP